MGKWKRQLVYLLLPFYVVTGIGGWLSHSQELRERATAKYLYGKRMNEEHLASARQTGEDVLLIELCRGGPITRVNWCVPVLPGLLLADSHSTIGPLWGRGGVKIVVWDGVGSAEVCTLCGWVA